MKITRKMIDTFAVAWHAADHQGTHVPGARRRAGLEAVLKDVPDVVPFTFPGYPDLPVYLHRCGTVMDASPTNKDLQRQIQAGECDCENTSPWMRIYVEKRA